MEMPGKCKDARLIGGFNWRYVCMPVHNWHYVRKYCEKKKSHAALRSILCELFVFSRIIICTSNCSNIFVNSEQDNSIKLFEEEFDNYITEVQCLQHIFSMNNAELVVSVLVDLNIVQTNQNTKQM